MTRLKKLLPASFKGIPFLVKNEVLSEGGRRIILHDYPNSSERFVEDQGELPPKFSMTAFVTGPDFIDRAEQLERALREEGKGSLSMPTFGIKKLYALPYRKDASQKEVGEIRFELEFVAGRSISGPAVSPKTPKTVYSQGDIAIEKIGNTLSEQWIIPNTTVNVKAAQYDLEQYTRAISKISTILSNPNELETISKFIYANSPSIVRSGIDISSSFVGDLCQTVSVGLSAGKGISKLLNLTSFGSELSLSLSDVLNAVVGFDIPLWNQTTAQRIIRNRNRMSLVTAGRVAMLATSYEQAADTTYKTDAEIEEVRSSLESEHQRLMIEDTSDDTTVQAQPEVRNAIEELRNSALNVLGQKEQSVYSLTTITNNVPVSSFVQSYTLYAEDFQLSTEVCARGLELRELNPTLPADKLVGEITVFQS